MKVLIVDDEQRTRDFLKNYVPWEELGIRQVETAKNGQAALDIASVWKPGIVICDIKMPKMDGIEFAREYRKLEPSSKIIFLSGFSDKEYLKSAIYVKALAYIDKPVVIEEVSKAVEDALILCREEELLKTETKRLQENADRTLPFLRQEMVRKLIKAPQSVHIEEALQSRETFLLPKKGPYTVGVAWLFWNASLLPEDTSNIQERMLQQLNLLDTETSAGGIFGFESLYWLVFVLPGDYDGSYSKEREKIDRLTRQLRSIAGEGIDLHLGMGGGVQHISNIPHSYELAVQAVIMQFYREDPHPYFFQPQFSWGVFETNWEEIRVMREELRREEFERVHVRIHKHAEKALVCCDRDIARVKDTFFQILLAILDAAVTKGLTEQTEDTERRYIWREIDAISSLSRLAAYVSTFLAPFEEAAEAGSAVPGKLKDIIRYIHAHFHEKGFTIKAIAEHVNLSETYLCSYFKKQRGETIKEYINATRYEQAKELLRDRRLKLFEVAVRLGFADANYFATFFKRCAGCTPSEYRERVGK